MPRQQGQWRKKRLAEGLCPICPDGTIEPGRAACALCLQRGAQNTRRWRVQNKPQYNAYMRQYMQARRALRASPRASQTPPEALLARAKELQAALGRAPSEG